MRGKRCVWFQAFLKRVLQKRFYVALLCIVPFLAVVVRMCTDDGKPLLSVALYNEGGTNLAEDTILSLTEQNGTISFYEVSTEEQLYRDVKTTKAECGYIFTDNYHTENVPDRSNLKKSVKTVKSPASILSGSVNELVFATYFKEYNRQLLTGYLKQQDVIGDEQDRNQIIRVAMEYFEQYIWKGNIVQFKNSSELQQEAEKEKLTLAVSEVTTAFRTNALRGIISILLLLAALCGGVQLQRDCRSGLFASVSPDMKGTLRLLDILAYVLPVAVSGYAGMLVLTAGKNYGKELLGLASCVVCVVFFAAVLERVSGSFYPVLIPLFVLGALVFAPVFVDLSIYAKIFVIPKYLFVNTYYLELVTGGVRELLRAGAVMVLLGVLYYLLSIGKERLHKIRICG